MSMSERGRTSRDQRAVGGQLHHVGQHHLGQVRAFGGTGLIARQRKPRERPVGRTGVDLDVAEPESALGVIGHVMGGDHHRGVDPRGHRPVIDVARIAIGVTAP
jgi:hypothetical protein